MTVYIEVIRMRYSDIANYPRPWDREKYPFVAHAFIPSKQFREFERLVADQSQAAVLGHDVADDGQVLVYVGCSSDEVKDLVESHWG
jgi:hypothetical protein